MMEYGLVPTCRCSVRVTHLESDPDKDTYSNQIIPLQGSDPAFESRRRHHQFSVFCISVVENAFSFDFICSSFIGSGLILYPIVT